MAGAKEFHFQFGQWISRVTEEESSNWRELTNLVEYLEERGAQGEEIREEILQISSTRSGPPPSGASSYLVQILGFWK